MSSVAFAGPAKDKLRVITVPPVCCRQDFTINGNWDTSGDDVNYYYKDKLIYADGNEESDVFPVISIASQVVPPTAKEYRRENWSHEPVDQGL